jgi:nicotinamide-nucleotide amidase
MGNRTRTRARKLGYTRGLMIIESITIGDELLKGMVVNTNTTFLSRHLFQAGYAVSRQTTLSDERESLRSGFKEALQRADLIIATGGLGPTLDDRTREVAAELFHSDFHFDQAIADEITRRFGKTIVSLENQATIPSKAKPLRNRVGTAPGLVFTEGGKTLILLPGVPKEMEPMFLEEVLPLVQKQWQLKEKKGSAQLFFCLVYESLLDPHLRELSHRYPSVEVGIYPAHGTLSVMLSAPDKTELDGFQRELTSRFSNYQYLSQSGKIEEAIQNWFIPHKKTLAFAESCTGGMLATHITAIPGASEYFLGSFVVYSNQMKEGILDVSALQDIVSEGAVQEMLAGVFKKTSADFAIAVSGIAGPSGGTEQKPVGTICAAIGERGKSPDVGTFRAFGNRQTIILLTTQWLLGALWRKVETGIPAFPLLPS